MPIHKFIILLLLFLLFIITPSELYLRSKYSDFETTDYYYTIHNFHPYLQFQLTPDKNLHINNDGFRSEEISLTKPKNTYRIFILGGSTVYNGQLSYQDTPTQILERLLSKRYKDKRIEVINAGVDAYTTEHSLIQYLFKIKDYHPDLIIMYHGINDLYFSCSRSDRAYGEYKADYSHYLSADGTMVFQYFSPPPPVKIKLLSYDFFIKAIQDNLFTDITFINNKKPKDPDIYTHISQSNEYAMRDPSLSAYDRNVTSLIEAVKADHTRLILGNQANIYTDNPPKDILKKIWIPATFCPKNNKIPSLSSFNKSLDQFNKHTQEIAQENDVPFVDLAALVPKDLTYFVDDVHYTKKGSVLIAHALYEKIISLDIIN